MKVLVLGYGSIGKRHVANLTGMDIETYVVTSHPDTRDDVRFLRSLDECPQVDCVVICTPTHRHLKDLIDVYKKCRIKKVLIEKPIDVSLEKALKIKGLAEENEIDVFVAYNMRFLKVFDIVKKNIKEHLGSIRLIRILAGQYLPEWRLGKDYRKSYSANKNMGGGVDLDLSHEIDYMLWLFGMPSSTLAILKEKISNLDIDSVDYFKGIYKYSDFIVDVELDCIRRRERRLTVLGENKEILDVDFIEKYVSVAGEPLLDKEKLFNFEDSYIEELKEFLGLSSTNKLCTVDDGINILRFIKRD